MAKVTDIALGLAQPIAEANGCSVWDVEYVKEAGTWFLRVYLDKPEGVNITDCETVSRALSDRLDEVDPIEGSYVLEVSSPGADRTLKKPEHFARFLGSQVEVHLYRPLDGQKTLVGELTAYGEDGSVTVATPAASVTLSKKDVALTKLYITI